MGGGTVQHWETERERGGGPGRWGSGDAAAQTDRQITADWLLMLGDVCCNTPLEKRVY